MSKAFERFRKLCGEGHDIVEHLGLLRGLAMDHDVKNIVEIGFRKGVSATALCTADKTVTSYDIERCQPHASELEKIAPKFLFVRGDSLKINLQPCELLHIDSLHTHDHLLAELRRHSPACLKWIALHDTETFGKVGKDKKSPGLMDAMMLFLKENVEQWDVQLHLRNCNGMTLLRRKR